MARKPFGGAAPAGMYRPDSAPEDPCEEEKRARDAQSARMDEFKEEGKRLVAAWRKARAEVNRLTTENQTLDAENDARIEELNWWDRGIKNVEAVQGDYSFKRSKRQNEIKQLEQDLARASSPQETASIQERILGLTLGSELLQKKRMEAGAVAEFNRSQIQSLSDDIQAYEAHRAAKADELERAKSEHKRAGKAKDDHLERMAPMEREYSRLFDIWFDCITKPN